MACESPYSVSINSRWATFNLQKWANGDPWPYDINPAGFQGYQSLDPYYNIPVFCPCDERITHNSPSYSNATLWARTACCSPCSIDASESGSRLGDNYYNIEYDKFPPLYGNKLFQCTKNLLYVAILDWRVFDYNRFYIWCQNLACWKQSTLDPYNDIVCSGYTMPYIFGYYFYPLFAFLYQSNYEETCCATNTITIDRPEEYNYWNRNNFIYSMIPLYSLAYVYISILFFLSPTYHYYLYNNIGMTVAKSGKYKIKMTSFLAYDTSNYTGPPLPGSDKGLMQDIGYVKIDKENYFGIGGEILPDIIGQPCNSFERFGYRFYSGYQELLSKGIHKGGIIKPDEWLGLVGNYMIPDLMTSDKILTTDEIFFVSCIIVLKKNGNIKAYFGYNEVDVEQSDLIQDYVLTLPLSIPEYTINGIVYSGKNIPFEMENSWYNTDEIQSIFQLASCNSGGCNQNYLRQQLMEAACTNGQLISPSFRKKMLEKQVLARIKKVHYKP